jgi:hypothetical protein
MTQSSCPFPDQGSKYINKWNGAKENASGLNLICGLFFRTSTGTN